MLPIKQELLTHRQNRPFLRDPDRYAIKKVKGIIIHWTANTNRGAGAMANRNYFNRGLTYASAHYCVDDKNIIQCIPDNEVGYHVGSRHGYTDIGKSLSIKGSPNYTVVGIELCVNRDADWSKTYKNGVELTQHLIAKHNLSTKKLYRHYDITWKDCPKMMVEESTPAWYRFIEHVKGAPIEKNRKAIKKVRVISNKLNIRTGYASFFDKDGFLKKGDEVNVVEEVGNWLRIKKGRWIHSDYTETIFAKGVPAKVNTARLNVRKGPGTNFNKVGQLLKGEVINVIDQSGNWRKIGENKWVHGDYILMTTEETGQVTATILNVRSGPGVQHPKVSVLEKGDVVKIHAKDNGWYRIGPGKWVSGKFVK